MSVKLPQELVDQIVEGLDHPSYHDLDAYYGVDENSLIAKDVLKNKYFAPWEESPFDMWVRLAWGAAQAEKEEERLSWAKKYFSILRDYKFLPGGRINYGLGRDDINVSFSNCYVVPIKEDSLEGIYTCLTEEAKTYKTGGGCGHDLSILRPRGTDIKGSGGSSCGPVGFMNLFSVSTNTVQQNNRRGANMQSILCTHPDIQEFIGVKNDVGWVKEIFDKIIKVYPATKPLLKKVMRDFVEKKRNVQHSNISVKILDAFMEAIVYGKDLELTWGGKVYKVIKSTELWDLIIGSARDSGEPGLMFWDRMRETNNLEYINPILSSNPCSEIPLGAYANCLLGHMTLPRFVVNGLFDFDDFIASIRVAQRFLDNIITLNDGRHALPQQNDVARNERRTGLGITGLGDALVMLGYKYGAEESIEFTDKLSYTFMSTAYDTSCDLAVERGVFPWFQSEGFFQSKFAQRLPEYIKQKIQLHGIRNGMLLTCAPVGSGSIIAQTSSGIEPIFRISYIRKVKDEQENYTEYRVYHPLIKSLFVDKELSVPDYVIDSSEVVPSDRVNIQATIQKYIDNSISSTVNLPREATKEQVSDIYLRAWKSGCKGITVYREGSREGILLSEEEYKQASEEFDLDLVESAENGKKRYTLKRPKKLQGETYKIRTDTGGSKGPVNCYYTINFFPNSEIPYELLVSEPPGDKDMKDVLMLEFATRATSMMLRHRIPIEFIVQQYEKLSNQYYYSLPLSIAKVLRNYIAPDTKMNGEVCSACGSENVRFENGCYMCADCGNGKCSG